ncbi:MAG: bifunctional 4-hydroxy-2-oxoglutarate aldolase/2-dehydro-3-deoxy-phosphogluconate aldolase [Anaerolineae bacterium]|nr:MAG: bifunctional 4-hydroxy-2-oxoglutarate aldolase/2-dehydro-3-deoxy-phosphogluconate aldolase [Anaerolineae bacterium]
MGHQESLDLIRRTGVVAIMRAKSSEQLLHAADAIRAGGVRVIEVTMTTPGALSVIEQAVARYGQDVLFGAGTVLDAQSARAAILAGAQFIVAPTYSTALIETCRRYSIPVMPGAFTPTEILTAWECGADMVKVFPASLGGPALIKAIKAPLPQIELVPVGGVNLDTTADFVRAGAAAVGVGGALIDQKLLDDKDFATLTDRARRFVGEVARGRTG